jgi:hypothetical protein
MDVRISFCIAVCALLTPGARAQVINEYQVKAAFIYNFSKFVEWPPQVFKTATTRLRSASWVRTHSATRWRKP